MPELPEVETTVRGMRSRLAGHTIIDFWCDHSRMIRYISPNQFKKLVTGKKILRVRRRAKHILIDLSSNKTIVAHMKMTGHFLFGKYAKSGPKVRPWEPALKVGPLNDPYNRFIHAVFTLSNGNHLVFCDMRKFGKIAIHDTQNLHTAKELENLGPELWELDASKFIAIYLPRRQAGRNIKSGKIKLKLLDQTILAGVGNIYSDEGLWTSGIHPLSRPNKIPEMKLKKLFNALVIVTKTSLKTGGDSMSDYRNIDGVGGKFQNFHKAYRQTNKKCKKKGCGGMMKRIVVGTRSAHYCDKHQVLYS